MGSSFFLKLSDIFIIPDVIYIVIRSRQERMRIVFLCDA